MENNENLHDDNKTTNENAPVKTLESKDEIIARLESEAARAKDELENVEQGKKELQDKLERLIYERNMTAQILRDEVAELSSKFEKAGLKISEKGVISVLDYSNYQKRVTIAFNMFDSDLNMLLKTINRIGEENNADYSNHTKRVENLLDESVKLRQLFDYLNEFILNPPSKEFMALMNNTLGIRKIAQDYKEFQNLADITKIKASMQEQENIFNEMVSKFDSFAINQNKFFEDEINKIENFKGKINARLNDTGDEYKRFSENMISNLNDQLKVFEINLAEYKEIREKEVKLLSKLKKGGYALTGLLFLLCLALGGVVGYAISLVK
ncbi:Uncharacterised protein [Campylobacter hyointestinalis]|uniref:Uncharacterized protein n=4 Tax=Campylobacter TaxID=194 RepID=A0A825BE71_CAMFE|nr:MULTISPECIES: hypothetical protein [Campylobacter]OCS16478.1 hypothetical protein CfvWBT01109_02705 [Campylobacter fetus subsp. venerealis]CBH51815.1 hypothetical protein [Campylobacter fetus subsp. fetus]EAI8859280.1 hypothetical protein [Campylobacter fetus]EGK8193090.1 hypothetical protein [Campylobacter fetus]KAB0613153.1 hypothetical protein F7P66_04030 [Campylobacter hyointestinalis subsp. lawsonii]